jgi:hypothetical protein
MGNRAGEGVDGLRMGKGWVKRKGEGLTGGVGEDIANMSLHGLEVREYFSRFPSIIIPTRGRKGGSLKG